MGLHWSLGWGEGLRNACKRGDSLILSPPCSLPASSLSKHSGSLDSWRVSVSTSHGTLAGLRKPGPFVLRVLSPWVPALCLKAPLLSKTKKLSHCSEGPCLSVSLLPQAREIPSCTSHFSKSLCFFCQTLSSSVGLKLRKHKPENLAGFLFCMLLPGSCPKAMNQRAGYLLWWRKKKGKHRKEIYLN